ncbi:MAG: glycine C-acetyltransferase [Nitrospirae bacterium]|nr:glycine C-acetyltransferase [Nitrospirota bacterium]
MYTNLKTHLQTELQNIHEAGLFKEERLLSSAQGVYINVNGKQVINMCANNYLGLSNHPEIIAAAKAGLEKWGYGLSSVRFICGTQDIHKELEKRLSAFLNMEDTILYTSCFDANTGLFEALFDERDSILSDELNHASIIDGIRLCKTNRLRFKHKDMNDLEEKLKECVNARFRIVATDGVFSMDGEIAPLKEICLLAEKYDALVMVDDSHATGFLGPTGRGSIEYAGVMGKVDILTSTLGKALGGASGGFTSSHSEIISMLRQKSRPYLFSNSIPPVIVSTAITILKLIEESAGLREKLMENTTFFRKEMAAMGYKIKEGIHPIIPVMLGEAQLAVEMSKRLLTEGVYVVGFSYPVVPKGQARIRIQISAAHAMMDLDSALNKFKKVGKSIGII